VPHAALMDPPLERRRAGWAATLAVLATCLAACGEAPPAPAPAPSNASGGAAEPPGPPPGFPTLADAPAVTVQVTALDIVEAFARGDERARIVAPSAVPGREIYFGAGIFEKHTQLASDRDHPVVRAPAGAVLEVSVGPLGPEAHLLARTLVYSALGLQSDLADPAPVTFRILVDGVERVALRSDYILQPGPSEHPYDRLMRTLDVPLPEAAERAATLRFEVTRLGAPEPPPELAIPETVWWDLVVQQPQARPRASADRAHPNVLFLLVDTLAARHTSLHGSARDTTPHLAALAARGLRFERALSMSSWTLPATASLLTGLPPNAHGVLGDTRSYLMDGLRTWPEVLREQGVEGAAFVANTLVSKANNFDQGFGHWEQANDETAEQLNARLLAWLDGQPRGARWLGYVHYMDPHAPYAAPGDARNRFADGPPAPDGLSRLLPERVQRGEAPMPDAAAQAQLAALYDAEVAYFDACLGRLVAALEQRGLLESTLVVLTSDHGEELFDHGRWGHGYTLYDELLHVPLVVTGPGFPAGRVHAEPMSTASVTSLVLQAAGAPLPDGILALPGAPAAGAVTRVFSAVRTSLFGPQRNLVSVQDAARKLVWVVSEDPDAPPEVECFDLRSDPLEQRPLPHCDDALLGDAQAWYRASAARRLPEPQPANPDQDEALRAIGYLGSEAPPAQAPEQAPEETPEGAPEKAPRSTPGGATTPPAPSGKVPP
jgi:arylsulfatase A-like enzyme